MPREVTTSLAAASPVPPIGALAPIAEILPELVQLVRMSEPPTATDAAMRVVAVAIAVSRVNVRQWSGRRRGRIAAQWAARARVIRMVAGLMDLDHRLRHRLFLPTSARSTSGYGTSGRRTPWRSEGPMCDRSGDSGAWRSSASLPLDLGEQGAQTAVAGLAVVGILVGPEQVVHLGRRVSHSRFLLRAQRHADRLPYHLLDYVPPGAAHGLPQPVQDLEVVGHRQKLEQPRLDTFALPCDHMRSALAAPSRPHRLVRRHIHILHDRSIDYSHYEVKPYYSRINSGD